MAALSTGIFFFFVVLLLLLHFRGRRRRTGEHSCLPFLPIRSDSGRQTVIELQLFRCFGSWVPAGVEEARRCSDAAGTAAARHLQRPRFIFSRRVNFLCKNQSKKTKFLASSIKKKCSFFCFFSKTKMVFLSPSLLFLYRTPPLSQLLHIGTVHDDTDLRRHLYMGTCVCIDKWIDAGTGAS